MYAFRPIYQYLSIKSTMTVLGSERYWVEYHSFIIGIIIHHYTKQSVIPWVFLERQANKNILRCILLTNLEIKYTEKYEIALCITIENCPQFLFYFILFLNFTILYYFCQISKWIRTGIPVFPILYPPPSSLPIPSLWVVSVHQPQASSIVHQTWTGDLFHTWYYTCFNAILPNLPTLSLSHRVHKTDLYISISFAVSYTGLLLPSF